MDQSSRIASHHRQPWNKGKLVGQKAPLRLKEIWAIRIRLQLAERTRELALFNLVVDSKLRSCDLLIYLQVRVQKTQYAVNTDRRADPRPLPTSTAEARSRVRRGNGQRCRRAVQGGSPRGRQAHKAAIMRVSARAKALGITQERALPRSRPL